MATRGRMRGSGRSGGLVRQFEDDQPNDSLSRNRHDIPRVRATHRPYHHNGKRGTNVSHSGRKSQPLFDRHAPVSRSDPATGPRPLAPLKTTRSVPSGPRSKRPSMASLGDLAPRKRQRTESPPPFTPSLHKQPATSIPVNHEHSFPRVPGSRSHAIVADVIARREPSPLEPPVNTKRESSPVVIDLLDCPPSPPLFEKLGLPAKTSGSYHVAMIDQCRKGAVSYMEHRQEWKDSALNAVRFVRGHDFPPLTIERCFIR